MQYDRCAGEAFTKAGRDRYGRQRQRCGQCRRRLTARSASASAFSGYRFPDEVIALSVHWYLRFRLSYADVAEWLAEQGITVDPSTVYDWVHAFTPRFIEAARRHRHPVGRKWRVDETRVTTDKAKCYPPALRGRRPSPAELSWPQRNPAHRIMSHRGDDQVL